MPTTFQYENNQQGIIVTAVGTVDGEDFLKKMEEFFSDEQKIRNYKYGINDFTQVEKYNISPSQIFSLAKLHIMASKINQDIVVGFAINKPVVHGLVRIWMAYAEMTGWRVNIEKTLPEIRIWVDKSVA